VNLGRRPDVMAEEIKPDLKKLCPDCEREIEASARRCPFCDFPLAVYDDLDRVAKVRAKSAPPKEPEKKPDPDPGPFDILFGR
jgi:predicted amidophosphoribosyltransferase